MAKPWAAHSGLYLSCGDDDGSSGDSAATAGKLAKEESVGNVTDPHQHFYDNFKHRATL